MKAILEFDLPEDEIEFQLATKAADLQSALYTMDQWLRTQTKHAPENMHDEAYNAYEVSRDKLREIAYDYNINL